MYCQSHLPALYFPSPGQFLDECTGTQSQFTSKIYAGMNEVRASQLAQASERGWFSNISFTTGLKTLPTFRPDALIFALKKTRASGRNVAGRTKLPMSVHCISIIKVLIIVNIVSGERITKT